jgi:hypothetical protein
MYFVIYFHQQFLCHLILHLFVLYFLLSFRAAFFSNPDDLSLLQLLRISEVLLYSRGTR